MNSNLTAFRYLSQLVCVISPESRGHGSSFYTPGDEDDPKPFKRRRNVIESGCMVLDGCFRRNNEPEVACIGKFERQILDRDAYILDEHG